MNVLQIQKKSTFEVSEIEWGEINIQSIVLRDKSFKMNKEKTKIINVQRLYQDRRKHRLDSVGLQALTIICR